MPLVTPSDGYVTKQQRIWLSVDWKRAPAGRHRIPVTISAIGERPVIVYAVVNNDDAAAVAAFVATDGYISMEAAHYSKAINTNAIKWQHIPHYGRTLSGGNTVPCNRAQPNTRRQ
jgi:hypothetical protein